MIVCGSYPVPLFYYKVKGSIASIINAQIGKNYSAYEYPATKLIKQK